MQAISTSCIPLLLSCLVVFVWFSSGGGEISLASDVARDIQMGEPEEKLFRAVRHYHYRERMYDPRPNIIRMKMPPNRVSGPEEVLASQVSAMRSLDIDWWLSTWDKESRDLLAERFVSGTPSKQELLEIWRERFRSPEVSLVRWIEHDRFVIITYQPRGGDHQGREYPVAFKLLAQEGWVATLELRDNPVLLYFGANKDRIERDVRSQRPKE